MFLVVARCNDVRMHFFTNRVLDVWNSLPESVMFSSLGAFKWSVRTVDFVKF